LLTYSSKNTKKRIKDKKQNKKGSSHYTFDTCLKVEVENGGGDSCLFLSGALPSFLDKIQSLFVW